MKTTFQQGKGRYNKNYWTALFWFEDEDKHFFLRKDKSRCNWMPKHTEISQMIKGCIEVEPVEKREKLKQMWLEAIEEAMNSDTNYNN